MSPGQPPLTVSLANSLCPFLLCCGRMSQGVTRLGRPAYPSLYGGWAAVFRIWRSEEGLCGFPRNQVLGLQTFLVPLTAALIILLNTCLRLKLIYLT